MRAGRWARVHAAAWPALLGVALIFAWCALWGGPSVANVASGTAIAAIVVGAVSRRRRRSEGAGPRGIRIGPLARLLALVATDLVRSTVSVAYEVLTPTDHTKEAIVAVPLPPTARPHLLLLVVGITVTPGTAVVDYRPDTGNLYLHLLHRSRREEVEAHAQRLAELASAAFPQTPAPASDRDPAHPVDEGGGAG